MKWLTDINEPGAWVLITGTFMICASITASSCHYKETEETRIKFEDTDCETMVIAITDKCMANGQKVLCLQELPAALKECR